MTAFAHPSARSALALLLLLASPAALAAAPLRSPQLDEARQLVEEAEFESAIKILHDALSQPDNSDAMLAALYELQGTAYLYLGREEKAHQAFERLLQASPDHELPKGTSTKIRTLFEQVREDTRGRRVNPAKLAHEPLTRATQGERLDVRAEISDVPQGAKARLYYRRAGTEGYSSTSFAPEADGWLARIPAFELPEESADYALEYYLEIGDAGGRRLAGVGDALGPLSVRVSSAADAPAAPAAAIAPSEAWYQKWWVWTIAGVVVAGAAAAVAVPLALDDGTTLPVTIKVQP